MPTPSQPAPAEKTHAAAAALAATAAPAAQAAAGGATTAAATAAQAAAVYQAQAAYFARGATLDVNLRINALARLKRALKAHERELLAAVEQDLGKPAQETYMTELALVYHEITYLMAHVRRWSRPRFHTLELYNAPAIGGTVREPWGVALVLGCWNYPLQLALEPLVGAIAGGNCCVLKPADHAPATAAALTRIIQPLFDPVYLAVVNGNHVMIDALLGQPFDHVFVTSSPRLGKVVLDAAATHLTPATLELGGCSPAIILPGADLAKAARRLVWGRFLNSGQTCVAPDYVLVSEAQHDAFIGHVKREMRTQLGEHPLDNPTWSHMVNQHQFAHVMGLLAATKGQVVMGGGARKAALTIEPTLVDGVAVGDALVSQEIFGPVLPVLTYRALEELVPAVTAIDATPLACYIFAPLTGAGAHAARAQVAALTARIHAGGVCLNDCVIQLATSKLPFGGVGTSGMGNYHGRWSFDTFTHEKPVVWRGKLDVPARYRPYTAAKFAVVRALMR
jgi:aldehyde dehydrogenase (NAD+)